MKRQPMMKGFEVEWCNYLPKVRGDDTACDFDRATFIIADFPNGGLALAYAVKVFPEAVKQIGSVGITQFEMQPLLEGQERPLTREYTSDRIEYSGPDSLEECKKELALLSARGRVMKVTHE